MNQTDWINKGRMDPVKIKEIELSTQRELTLNAGNGIKVILEGNGETIDTITIAM